MLFLILHGHMNIKQNGGSGTKSSNLWLLSGTKFEIHSSKHVSKCDNSISKTPLLIGNISSSDTFLAYSLLFDRPFRIGKYISKEIPLIFFFVL